MKNKNALQYEITGEKVTRKRKEKYKGSSNCAKDKIKTGIKKTEKQSEKASDDHWHCNCCGCGFVYRRCNFLQ